MTVAWNIFSKLKEKKKANIFSQTLTVLNILDLFDSFTYDSVLGTVSYIYLTFRKHLMNKQV